jgi:RNA recognition motif-containing protein
MKGFTMNKKLYVGNLSNEVTEEDLTHNFSTVGKVVSVAIIKDRYSNQSKGFGFVEMDTEESAKQAIERFNGGELQGKKIIVSEAREKKPDREGGFSRGGRSGPGASRGPGQGRGGFGRGGGQGYGGGGGSGYSRGPGRGGSRY